MSVVNFTQTNLFPSIRNKSSSAKQYAILSSETGHINSGIDFCSIALL